MQAADSVFFKFVTMTVFFCDFIGVFFSQISECTAL